MFFTALFSGCYVPMVDFLTIITLLYLFYFQGMQTLMNADTSRSRIKKNIPDLTILEISGDNENRQSYNTDQIKALLLRDTSLIIRDEIIDIEVKSNDIEIKEPSKNIKNSKSFDQEPSSPSSGITSLSQTRILNKAVAAPLPNRDSSNSS